MGLNKRILFRSSLALLIAGGIFLVGLVFFLGIKNQTFQKSVVNTITQTPIVKEILPTPTVIPVPNAYTIPQRLHIYQSFNNCGPATLSMALSYVGINKDQQELGQILRPYQIPGGDNDDKSVTLEEVANHAQTYGPTSYLRPNGDIEKLKQFIANDIPVVTRSWLHINEDIGHYRIIRGYDESRRVIIQDDSLEGENLEISYDEFNEMWRPFNYEYLVIVDSSKKELTETILGENLDTKIAWSNAKNKVEKELSQEPNNVYLHFALSRIYYHLGDYTSSVKEFSAIENQLSFRTLWYQIEPIQALYMNGEYERVLALTERILNKQNRAFSELYVIRAAIFRKQGNEALAQQEIEKATLYNKNLNQQTVLPHQ